LPSGKLVSEQESILLFIHEVQEIIAMKKLLLFCFIFFAAGSVNAQVSCPIPCSLEQFPYIFCSPGGTEFVQCSSEPNEDGGTLVKAFLPNCIHVDQTSPIVGELIGMPPVGKTQALGPVPGPMPSDSCAPSEPFPDPIPLNRLTWYEDYVNHILMYPDSFYQPGWYYSVDDPIWDGDTAAYNVWYAQWILDSIDFVSGGSQETTPYDPDDPNQLGIIQTWANQDTYYLWELYDEANAPYESEVAADSAWADCDSIYSVALSKWDSLVYQVQYVTVWTDSGAQNDANNALSQWYSACPGLETNNCCVRINFDQQKSHFASADYSLGSDDSIVLALTPPPTCADTSCPDSNSVFIDINVTENLLFASNATDPIPDSNYPASVASRTFFTGPTAPNVNPGFETISFRYTMEHELGHWLGFSHTNVGGCPNNTDSCSGYPSVMNTVEAPNTDPMGVTCEDKNMFRKLYCPSTPCQNCVASVAETVDASVFKAGIFPNPTSGACLLQYQLTDPAFVQIAIYDVLGKEVRSVSSGYEETGEQSISLGTETLPSGNYICRVSVGDQVSYINLAITK
jgi:hypothetical protein